MLNAIKNAVTNWCLCHIVHVCVMSHTSWVQVGMWVLNANLMNSSFDHNV